LKHARRALSKHGIFGIAKKFNERFLRASVYRFDEVLVFSDNPSCTSSVSSEFETREGTIKELATLSAQHPDFLTKEILEKARLRLKNKDRLFLTWQKQKCVHVAWTGIRSEITAKSDVGPGCDVPLPEQSLVVYDCWTPPNMRGQGIYSMVLNELIRISRADAMKVWIFCRGDNVASRRGIEKVGFLLKYRMKRVQWCRLWEKKSVTPVK
jgi:predicted GNAT family acetyltransferase